MWGGSATELVGKEVVLKEYSEDNTIAPAIPITDYRIKAKITLSRTKDCKRALNYNPYEKLKLNMIENWFENLTFLY